MTARLFAGKRGQAAHEFLTTYGWTALLALLTLGVMFYFGAIDRDALVPSRCSFPAETGAECMEARATSDGELRLRLFNADEARLLRGAECVYAGTQTVTTRQVTVDSRPLNGHAWGGDEFITLSCRFDGDNPFAGRVGAKQGIEVRLFLESASGEASTATADVRTRVEASA